MEIHVKYVGEPHIECFVFGIKNNRSVHQAEFEVEPDTHNGYYFKFI